MKKRIFAALLALVMLLGALPVTASAAGSPSGLHTARSTLRGGAARARCRRKWAIPA